MCDMRRLFFAILILLFSVALIAGDKKTEASHSSVSFTVLKDDTGKPVRNAAVILHSLEASGKQSRGGFELKTDNDGKTHFDGVPYGPLRVQVIARGFQTYGEDVNIAQAEQEITIQLKRPQEQYSIYEKGGSALDPEKKH
jgi:carboxypeptidase family protein